MPDSSTVLPKALVALFRPLARLLLNQGVAFDTASGLLKAAYIKTANEEFPLEGKKQTASRISTLTGLTRKEVTRGLNTSLEETTELSQPFNRAARVISGWVRDKDFPREIPLKSTENSFENLVQRYSGDIPARAIADELFRVGAIEKRGKDKVKLVAPAYIPKNIDEKIKILGTDVADLISTINHNIECRPDEVFFQRKVSYNAIPASSLPMLRKQLNKKAQSYLESLDKIMCKHDSDANLELTEQGGQRAGVSIFYFEETHKDE